MPCTYYEPNSPKPVPREIIRPTLLSGVGPRQGGEEGGVGGAISEVIK